MFLKIMDSMTVEELQDRFQECFPFLTIALYSKNHKKFQASEKRYELDGKMLIGDIRRNHYSGILEIKSWHTTAWVEKKLKDIFGLNAQIFRWDGINDWIQTSASDALTLQQQNQLSVDQNLQKN